MTNFKIHTLDTAPEDSKGVLEGLEKNLGFIPNLAATFSESPVALNGFVALLSGLRQASLSPVEREVVGLTVSHENECPYSMAAHSTFATAAGTAPEVVAALRAGESLPDARLQLLHAFTKEVLRHGGLVPAEDVSARAEAGYSNDQVLEILTQIAYTTLANLAANLADVEIDEAFRPQAWQSSAA
jgi:uncharacterized peroxidase-related enzyme